MFHWVMAIGLDFRLELVAVVLTPIFYWGFFSTFGMTFGEVFIAVLASLFGSVVGGIMVGGAAMFVWEHLFQLPVKRPDDIGMFMVFGYVASILICMVGFAREHLKDKRSKTIASGES